MCVVGENELGEWTSNDKLSNCKIKCSSISILFIQTKELILIVSRIGY